MTLFGWDASDFDWSRGPMNLAAAKADGITWFTHKATEATSTKHVHLADALTRARAAGFEFMGAYHVVRSSPSVDAQVAYFLDYLDKQVPWWRDFDGFMLQVDLELWSYDQVSAATGMAFAQALQAAQPRRVLTYASRGMYGNSLTGIGTPLWNANYGSNPVAHYPDAYPGDKGAGWMPYSGQAPVMWQYGSQLTIGTQVGCDANAYRGTLADLRQLIVGGSPTMGAGMSYTVRSGAEDGSIYLVPGGLASTGLIAAFAIYGDEYSVLPRVQLPKGTTVVGSGLYDVAPKAWPTGSGGGTGGPTLAQITAAVRAELDATKLGRA